MTNKIKSRLAKLEGVKASISGDDFTIQWLQNFIDEHESRPDYKIPTAEEAELNRVKAEKFFEELDLKYKPIAKVNQSRLDLTPDSGVQLLSLL